MSHIWAFLLQTTAVSLVAGLLLFLKWIFEDKLSPRWQYGIWSILVLRLLLPASLKNYVLVSFLWLEVWKTNVEAALHSAYQEAYMPISNGWGIFIPKAAPQSITDWLFIIYLIGVFGSLLWYILGYCRLRFALRKGNPVSDSMQQKINEICQKYQLKKVCPAVTVSGLPTAFVCGVLRPVLVIPENIELDDKVLLHELLHLNYFDAVQNIVWCVFRCLHWCNPFLQYTFNRIGNDMESLCDQRVLERLEGEERREYGNILLGMANERYARALGTTSLSNGGKNISRRIEAIVRFKKYPKGMALVSVCIGIILLCPTLVGAMGNYNTDVARYNSSANYSSEMAMAMTRVNRCTTIAGALDTYAKGLIFQNAIYIATASPLSRQEELTNLLEQGNYYYNAGYGMNHVLSGKDYWIYNLWEYSENAYQALLAFYSAEIPNTRGITVIDSGRSSQYATVLVPVIIRYEDAWVVEETGERQIISNCAPYEIKYLEDVPAMKEYFASSEYGTVKLQMLTVYQVNNSVETVNNGILDFLGTGGTGFDRSLKTDAEFYLSDVHIVVQYCWEGKTEDRPHKTATMQIIDLSIAKAEEIEFPTIDANASDIAGSSTQGYGWVTNAVDETWDGTLWYGTSSSSNCDKNGVLLIPKEGYLIRIFGDGELKSTLKLAENDKEGAE